MDLSERPAESASALRRHPWEMARFQFFQRVLAQLSEPPAHVLDAGAGDGWFSGQLLASLPAGAEVTCWDAHYTPEVMRSFAKEADPHVRFAAQRPVERFDLIMLLDVLEHVERDREFLSALVQDNLSPRGTLLISVPAWQSLFTAHDTRLRHYRRYSPAEGARLIEACGLQIVGRGGLFHGLLLPRALEKVRELLRPRAPTAEPAALEWKGGALLTGIIQSVLTADGALSRAAAGAGLELPGLSWWALCRRR